MNDRPDGLTDAQFAGLKAILRESLSDLDGRRYTLETVDLIRKRMATRIAIVDELIEHEEAPQ